LAWITILRRREGYRDAFDNFDARRIAVYTDADRERLMADARIIRNRAKIDAFIANARAFSQFDDFAALVWSFVDGAPIQNSWLSVEAVPAVTEGSGFGFVGPTICYAFMQSAGLVNDHVVDCFRHAELRPVDR
jgi:DNA-3-methyladenine glycosylase I